MSFTLFLDCFRWLYTCVVYCSTGFLNFVLHIYNMLLKKYNIERKYEEINSGDKVRYFYGAK